MRPVKSAEWEAGDTGGLQWPVQLVRCYVVAASIALVGFLSRSIIIILVLLSFTVIPLSIPLFFLYSVLSVTPCVRSFCCCATVIGS